MSTRLSRLDAFSALLMERHPGCLRCGKEAALPAYAHDIGMSPVCQACWGELEPEGRFQWVLMLMASWAADYRQNPISYEPDHPQARYRDWTLRLENARRVIFEGTARACPQFGPDYLPYRACYTTLAGHQLAALPALELQICTVWRAWFDAAGRPCLPWVSAAVTV